MPTPPARSGGSDAVELPKSLKDRVIARVAGARTAVDRREGASRPKAKRRRQTAVETSSGPSATDLREAESLKKVFRDLGVSYREYRKQTGEPVAPAVREAAYKFRADPSLTSLVSVAVFLDELDILTW
jgi:hypothetical protein